MSSPGPGFPTSPGSQPNPSSSLPTGSRPALDPNQFDGVRGLRGTNPADEAEEVDEVNGPGGSRGRGRAAGRQARNNMVDDIPRVKDTTGEKVMESFAVFLEK